MIIETVRIRGEAVLVWLTFVEERKIWVPGNSEIGKCEVREQRLKICDNRLRAVWRGRSWFTRSWPWCWAVVLGSIEMAGIAICLRTKQVPSLQFVGRELRSFVACQVVVEFRSELADRRMRFILRDRLRQFIVGGLCSASIDLAEIHRGIVRIVAHARLAAHRFGIAGPVYLKDLTAPDSFGKAAIRASRRAIYETREVGKAHFGGIVRRALGLLRCRIVQASSSRAPVPEVATIKVLLCSVIVHDRRHRRVGVARRFAVPIPPADRSWIRSIRLIQR